MRSLKNGKRFIDDFEVILLDMGNTFMFEVDRFGENEDYYQTYRRVGGRNLRPLEVRAYITDVYNRMLNAARDPVRYDDYGDVGRFLKETGKVSDLPLSEIELIVQVFSRHECGRVPETHACALRQLRRTHPLGMVSNVWSPHPVFEDALKAAGILDLFKVRVWSSDGLSIKPSPRLFQKALDFFDVDPARVVYVGDNPMRDIVGARALGMGAVWIRNEMRPLTPEIPRPDLIIADLTELAGARK
jgi:FMN phosphatase YigB (HAD superfamily)